MPRRLSGVAYFLCMGYVYHKRVSSWAHGRQFHENEGLASLQRQ
jgi:hypothetical protein